MRPGRAVIADVVSEGAAGRGTRTLRAELALKTAQRRPRLPRTTAQRLEQALVFSGATSPPCTRRGSDVSDQLCLVESAGVPRALYGLRDSYPLTGGSPAADAVPPRTAAVARPRGTRRRTRQSGRTPAGDFSLAALPLPPGPRGGGCLLAVSESPGGFDTEDRQVPRTARRGRRLPGAVRPRRGRLAATCPRSSFSLAMDTGRVEVDDETAGAVRHRPRTTSTARSRPCWA